MDEFIRGSEWRKWDLHLHTPSSYDYKNKSITNLQIVNQLKKNNISLAAITDHHRIDIDRYFDLVNLGKNDVKFLPGIELRTNLGGSDSIHIIAIFKEFSDKKRLEDLWNIIKSHLDISEVTVQDKGDENISVDFNLAVEVIKKHKGLISIHAGKKSNSLEEITNALPYKQAQKKEIANKVDLFEIGRIEDVDGYRTNVFPVINRDIPLIRGSDNHNINNYQIKIDCWIKADLTFNGLKQVLFKPNERVYLGEEPPQISNVRKDKQHFIDSISVNKITGATHRQNWFSFSIPLNSGLIAVIGSKGSGKSAFSDILGHLCQCNSMEHASFLHTDRFRQPGTKFAEDYEGEILWVDNHSNNLNLMLNKYDTSLEKAQYLPQKYIELICNDLEDKFQSEIDKVIFSYVDEKDRLNTQNLSELIAKKSKGLKEQKQELKNKLEFVNENIIKLENKTNIEYKKSILDELKEAREILLRHENNKPAEIKKPKNIKNSTDAKNIALIDGKIILLEKQIKENEEKYSEFKEKISEIEFIDDEISTIEDKLIVINKKINVFLGNKKDKINYLTLKKNLDSFHKIKAEIQKELLIISSILDNSPVATEKSLFIQMNKLLEDKKILISKATAEEQKYQKYLLELKEWSDKKKHIIGDINIDKSIKFLEHEKKYVEKDLLNDIIKETNLRNSLIQELYNLHTKQANIYKDIYKPIDAKLKKILKDLDDNIEFSVDILLKEKDLTSKLIDYINQSVKSPFMGKAEGYAKMDSLINSTEFNIEQNVLSFVNEIFTSIQRTSDNIEKVFKNNKRLDFYQYLTSLDFLNVEYTLKMGNRTLKELSPGERGILLLIFYLALNKDNKPLIIDQPEDNLDNESVYKKLVPCILEAKKTRQVIVVTHNPNIAVASDAEQIIYCKINKSKSEITYTSGSIENKKIREKAIDILEGTMPAFDLRRQKYVI